MHKTVIAIVTLVVFFSCNSAKKAADTGTMTNEKPGDWQSLFDGKTTKGWHKYGGGPVGAAWVVQESALCLDTSIKGGGDIVTDEEFDNFELEMEWKIAPKGNSGIIFYIHEDKSKYNWPWETGPEMQVLDNIGADDNKKENHLAGNLFDLLGNAANSRPKPLGEWNQAVIKSVNGKLDLYLNKINVVSTTLWDDNWKKMVAGSKFRTMPGFGTYNKGRIGLQDHGYGVCFRKIRIRKL